MFIGAPVVEELLIPGLCYSNEALARLLVRVNTNRVPYTAVYGSLAPSAASLLTAWTSSTAGDLHICKQIMRHERQWQLQAPH